MAVLALAISPAFAYPGSLNIIPCTDILSNNSFRLAYEADGSKQPFSDGYVPYAMTQYGIGGKMEVGVDVNNVGNDQTTVLNAKYLVTKGTASLPPVAVGAWNIGKHCAPMYYAVACKQLNKARLHYGAQTQAGSTWGMLGVDKILTPTLTLILDWQTGPGHLGTAGIYWQTTPVVGVLAYAGRNNTSELRDTTNFVGLNIAYTFTPR